MKRLILLLIFVAVSAGGGFVPTERGFSQTPPVMAASDFWTSSATAQNTTALVYGVLRNESAQDDALVAAHTSIAKSIELKFHDKTADRVVASIGVVPSHKYLKLRPSEFYIVLNGLTEELKPGRTFPITLQFAKSGPITAMVQVSENAPPPPPFTYAGGDGSRDDAYVIVRGARDYEEVNAATLAWLAKNEPDFIVGTTGIAISPDRKLLRVIFLCRGPCQPSAIGVILGDKQVYFDMSDVDFALIDPKDVN